MMEILRRTSLIIVCVLSQIVFFDHFHVMGYGVPLVYALFLFDYRSGDNVICSMLWGALLGVVVDIFHGTIGMNMMSMVLVVFFRRPLFDLFVGNKKGNGYTVDIASLGMKTYLQIVLITTFVYYICVLILEDMTLKYFAQLVWKAIAGTFSTTAFILFYNILKNHHRGHTRRI
ncbi:MAG: hypothetical protein Q4E55_01155 [Bacteroidales bacterium]|nr:hypothetical protein [Bacteroidales bacterium]